MADAADAVGQPCSLAAIDGWFQVNYPKIKRSTIEAHVRGMTANDPSRRHHPGVAAKEPLFFRTMSGELARFDPGIHPIHPREAGMPGAIRPARRSRRAARGQRANYIDEQVIASFEESAKAHHFDHTKLLRLIGELNDNYGRGNAYAAHALLRAILDHIPPMLGCASFTAVASNYRWSRTDKAYMRRLIDFRVQADDVLHRQISRKPDLLGLDDMPARACVNRLLQECARPAANGELLSVTMLAVGGQPLVRVGKGRRDGVAVAATARESGVAVVAVVP
jgi:hypothetical protein